MKLNLVMLLLLQCLWVPAAGAQDLPTGPTKGEKVPPLKVFDLTGENKDKEVDYAAERKDKPTVYLLINAEKWDRPMARFLRKLDEAIRKDSEESYLVAVWLTSDAGKTKEYLPRAQQSLQLQATALVCYAGEKTGPMGWNINSDAHLTVTVANRGRVIANFGYRTVNETDVPVVRDEVKKAITGK